MLHVRNEDTHQKSEHVSLPKSDLSQRGIKILHPCLLLPSVLQTNTPYLGSTWGTAPPLSSRSTWRPWEGRGPQWGRGGQLTAQRPDRGKAPLEAVTEKGTRFPRKAHHPGQDSGTSLCFFIRISQEQIRQKWGI